MISTGFAIVGAEVGLHARPAADLVRAVGLSQHQVFVTNESGRRVDGSSILGILSLAAKQGQTVQIEVEGPNANEVLEQLISVVSQVKQD